MVGHVMASEITRYIRILPRKNVVAHAGNRSSLQMLVSSKSISSLFQIYTLLCVGVAITLESLQDSIWKHSRKDKCGEE